MSKPDPTITADLLSKLPARKAEQPKAAALPGKKDHSHGPQPAGAKISSRSAPGPRTAASRPPAQVVPRSRPGIAPARGG